MAPRNSQDGKGPFKYSDTPPNCDGFNVCAMCDERCWRRYNGACWHQDRVRQMVRRWFLPLVPCRAQTIVRREPPARNEPTQKELAEMSELNHIVTILCERKHAEMYGHVPWGARHDWGHNGIGWTPFPDEDGVGGWGRVVRIVEDGR